MFDFSPVFALGGIISSSKKDEIESVIKQKEEEINKTKVRVGKKSKTPKSKRGAVLIPFLWPSVNQIHNMFVHPSLVSSSSHP